MEKLLKTLDLHRTSFTRIHDAAINDLQSQETDLIDVQGKLQILQQKIDILVELDKKLIDAILDDNSDDIIDIDEEMKKADHYVMCYNNLKLRVQSRMNSSSTDASSNSEKNINSGSKKVKLPTIKLKKFGGDIHEWLSFWSQFKGIHEDQHLSNEEKFQYLQQSMIPKSRAQQVTESYPPSGENYPKAIDSLKSRFGRDDLLVEVYVRELLKLIMNNFHGKAKLSYLYDKLETQLRALDTLGVTSDKCAAMLYPLIESCLPEEILRVWQRSVNYSINDPLKKRLDNLMMFLRNEVENEERIKLASSFETQRFKKKEDSTPIFTASGLMNAKIVKCIFCRKDHKSADCTETKNLGLDERKKILSRSGCCHLCRKFGHIARKCRSAVYLKCQKCAEKHLTIMCPKSLPEAEGVIIPTENLSNHTYNEVFLQTLVVRLQGKSKSRLIRVIIDTGSERSYINKYIASEMEFEPIKMEEMIHALFGGIKSEAINHHCYRVILESLDKQYSCSLEVLDQPIICNSVRAVHEGPWMEELSALGIQITDIKEGPIDILIGADVAGRLFSGARHVLKSGVVAMKTRLGWTLMGMSKNPSTIAAKPNSLLSATLYSRSHSIKDLWSLEILGIMDPNEQKTRKQHEATIMEHFLSTVTRTNDGRYQVDMPWIEGHPPLTNNFVLAKNRLDSLMNKLEKDNYYEEYHNVLLEWLSEGIIEEIPAEKFDVEAHYLPHRHVLKPNSSTTKLRPVFDASAKQKDSPSLNECLQKGVNLISLIPTVLLNFRLLKIGVISDIRKAFLQIILNERERNFVRFLWYDKDKTLKIFRHARVVFGITCSPFLLGAVINYHLQQAFSTLPSSSTISKLLKSFYIDNCVTSVETEEELHQFIRESQEVMNDAKFDLRGWEYNNFQDLKESDEELNSPVLGLTWERNTDTLRICLENFENLNSEPLTKRVILSIVNRIFDPIGFTSPVLIHPKILLQKAWTMKIGWNSEVPIDMKNEFLSWLRELNILPNLKIPRWIMQDSECPRQISLHIFCDASQNAYGTAIFLRTETRNGVFVQLVQAKSRVSPIKKMSIPRLELLAATIGARLHVSILDSFDTNNLLKFFWTDSSTVLSWIRRKDMWKPFVWNRIQEIKQLTDEDNWFHVPGILNPADLPSRGCTVSNLLQSRWWEGPLWLYKQRSEWPSQEFEIDEKIVIEEKRKGVSSLFCQNKIDFSCFYHYFSKYRKIVNMMAWVKRFIFNMRHPINRRQGSLTAIEKEESEKTLLRCVQIESFSGIEEKIGSLAMFQDDFGLFRLKTKISEREDLEEFRYPILLPTKHPVVSRLIFDTHIQSCHVGVQGLLSMLREKFWIIGGRKTLKSIISKCFICRRFQTNHFETTDVALPKERVRDGYVFEITGIDFFGHLFLRNKQKVWVCLFTCAIYRAVHLELVSSLSTDAFLGAFRRFISRRGRPSTVYSDNGGAFVGAQNAFSSLNWTEISQHPTIERITWKFNPPSAAWWGGWWERLIRLVKQLLIKVLRRACLTYEELSTVLCDCESVVNDRPLTYISEDQQDLATLTPALFLRDLVNTGVVDIDRVDAESLRRRHRYRQTIRDNLRKRFRNEYLGQLVLQKKRNNQHIPRIGEIVMVEKEDSKRIEWPLARVEELVLGKDGKARLIRLRTPTGSMLLPLQRIYPLEMHESDSGLRQCYKDMVQKSNDSTSDNTMTFTRYGRKVVPPSKLNL